MGWGRWVGWEEVGHEGGHDEGNDDQVGARDIWARAGNWRGGRCGLTLEMLTTSPAAFAAALDAMVASVAVVLAS